MDRRTHRQWKLAAVPIAVVAWGALVAGAVAATACGDDGDSPVVSSSSSSSSSSSGAASSSSGPGSSSSTSSSSSGSVEPVDARAVTGFLSALCAQRKRCEPKGYALGFATDAECIDSMRGPQDPTLFPGEVRPTTEQIDACTAKVNANTSCAIPWTELLGCLVRTGTLPNGAACNRDFQCSGGACQGPKGDCGKCATAGKEGEDCTNRACAKGFFCRFDTHTCTAVKAKGGACGTGDSCEEGTSCSSDLTCQIPRGPGSPCASVGHCYQYLWCESSIDGGTCIERDDVKDGEPCGYLPQGYVGCVSGDCVDTTSTSVQKCTPFKKEGEVCGTYPSARCKVGLECIDGTCINPALRACK